MAKQYKVSRGIKAINGFVTFLNKFGKGPPNGFILHTIGRSSGLPRSTPVTAVFVDGGRYLVAPYGAVGWVHNLRAHPEARLERKGAMEDITVSVVKPAEAGTILKTYFEEIKIVRPYFDAELGDGADVFADEGEKHPVFLIDP